MIKINQWGHSGATVTCDHKTFKRIPQHTCIKCVSGASVCGSEFLFFFEVVSRVEFNPENFSIHTVFFLECEFSTSTSLSHTPSFSFAYWLSWMKKRRHNSKK
jgi:hypothetical protein